MTHHNTAVRYQMERIGPAEAEKYLTRNKNRNLRAPHVTTLAHAMSDGQWTQNGDTIVFDSNGDLVDGQHRLSAVIESGVAINVLVVRGVAVLAQETMDNGLRRTPADVFQLRGLSNATQVASSLRLLWRYDNNAWGAEKATVQDLLGVQDKHPGVQSSVLTAGVVYRAIRGPHGTYAASHCLAAEQDAFAAERFFTGLASGEDLSAGDPVLALRRALQNRQALRQRLDPATGMGMFAKAWNAFRDERPVSLVKFIPSTETVQAFR